MIQDIGQSGIRRDAESAGGGEPQQSYFSDLGLQGLFEIDITIIRTCKDIPFFIFFSVTLSISHSPYPLASGGTLNVKIIESLLPIGKYMVVYPAILSILPSKHQISAIYLFSQFLSFGTRLESFESQVESPFLVSLLRGVIRGVI